MLTGNLFTHGYYCDTSKYDTYEAKDVIGEVHLKDNVYEGTFRIKSKQFCGIAIKLIGVDNSNEKGKITVSTFLEMGGWIESVSVLENELTDDAWYSLYLHKGYNPESVYKLKITTENCSNELRIRFVNDWLLPEEVIDGSGFVCFAYRKPTFSVSERIFLAVIIVSMWLLLMGWRGTKYKNACYYKMFIKCGYVGILLTALAWNYIYNSFDNMNEIFSTFHLNCEGVLTSMIDGEKKGAIVENNGYGLGTCCAIVSSEYSDNEDWTNGYNIDGESILIKYNDYSKQYIKEGYFIKFKNGQVAKIIGDIVNGTILQVFLEADFHINERECGDLAEIKVLDSNQQGFPSAVYSQPYISQVGLQGHVLRFIAKYIHNDDYYEILRMICAFLLSIVIMGIIIAIKKKYNALMSVSFYLVFLLSPWIVSYGADLFWVSFTLFLPMLIGINYSMYRDRSKRFDLIMLSCLFFATLVRSLCGYEFISTIMMSSISFLVADFVKAWHENKNNDKRRIFKSIVVLSICALAGFLLAILIHAYLRGDGNLIIGLKHIVKDDVLRRTLGSNLNGYDQVYWESLNASVWEVFCEYFHFKTQIIAGLSGNLFYILCIAPLCIFANDYRKNKMDVSVVTLYIWFFMCTMSWVVLAKSHSYIHGHLNFVLWYFGFVQICIYIVAGKIIDCLICRESQNK